MAVLTSINGGIAGVDALAGGWLAANWGFRSVFWVMAIIAVLAVVLIIFTAEESTAKDTPRMDWIGVILLVVAMGALLTAANAMQNSFGDLGISNGLFSILLVILAVICFIGFWQVEKRGKHPMVPTFYLKQRRTWGLLITTLLTMTGVFAVMNGIMPALVQDKAFGLGNVFDAGNVSWITLTPYALAGLLFGFVSGILAAKFGYLKVLRVGLITTVVGLVLAVIGAITPSIAIVLIISLFVGVTYAGISNIMLNGLGIVLSPADNPGYLPGLNAGMFNLGAGISFIILYAVPSMFHTAVGGSTGGYTSAIVTGLILVALAFATSFLIPNPKSLEGTTAE
jgi:MFS family permease